MIQPRVLGTRQERVARVRRVSAKVYLREDVRIDQRDLIPVFHRWIAADVFDQLLIDVADYRHVHHGPGVMLIGHEGHYAMDGGEGRLGLRFQQVRWNGTDPGERLRDVVRATLAACAQLEREDGLTGGVRFPTGEILLQMTDRLAARDTAETFNAWRDVSRSLFDDLYRPSAVRYDRADLDGVAGIRVRSEGSPDLASLLERIAQL